MNRIAEVAKLLGVEIGEEFEIDEYEGIYRITNDGVKGRSGVIHTMALNDLLTERAEIIKLPFRPKYNTVYHTISYNSFINKWDTSYTTFANTDFDLNRIALGNCYKTREEAELNKQKIIDLLSPYIEEVSDDN